MTKEDVLFILLRSALWGIPLNRQQQLDEKHFEVLKETAKKQTVKGLLYQAITENRVQLEKYDAINLFSEQGTLQEKSDAINQELHDVCNILTRHRITFFIVKGQTIARLYRQPGMRESGDIDIWCPGEDNFQRARAALSDAWQQEITDDGGSELEFQHGKQYIDLQRTLVEIADRNNLDYWNKLVAAPAAIKNTIDVAGTAVPTLEPTLNLLYTFLHLYHHFIELGIGLRHLCDMTILIHASHEQIDRDRLREMLVTMDYLTAFKAFGAICIEKLGLPKEEFPFEITAYDRSFMPKILRLVFFRGNFGKYGHNNAVRSGMGYYIEAFMMKIRHYRMFYRLSPKEIRAAVFLSIPRKIMEAVKRRLG